MEKVHYFTLKCYGKVKYKLEVQEYKSITNTMYSRVTGGDEYSKILPRGLKLHLFEPN